MWRQSVVRVIVQLGVGLVVPKDALHLSSEQKYARSIQCRDKFRINYLG